MINIAHVICSGSFAGAEAVACSLTRALAQQPGVSRSVLYLVQELRAGQRSCDRLVEQAGTFGIGLRLFSTRERLSARLLAQLWRAIGRDRVQVVHNHSYKAAFFSALARNGPRPGRRRPVSLFTIHGLEQQRWKDRVFETSVNAMGAYLSDALIGVSRPISEQYRALPLLARRVHTIPNAILSAEREPLATLRHKRPAWRDRLAARYPLARPEQVWVAIVGRLAPVKNHQLFLDVVEQTAADDRSPPAHFFIVGDGPLRDAIARRVGASAALTDRVTLTGHVDGIADLYRSIDLLMLTSHSEGSPMVVLEAMSYGIAPICSAVGGVVDLISDGGDGLLFAAGDRQQCADRLRQLLSDEVARARLGEAAYRKVQREFNPARWAERHLSLYRSLLDG